MSSNNNTNTNNHNQQQQQQTQQQQYSWARGALYQTCCAQYGVFEMQNVQLGQPIRITVKTIYPNIVTKIKR